MTVVKIKNDAVLRINRHVYRHDDIVYRTIKKMRSLGMYLFNYDENILCPYHVHEGGIKRNPSYLSTVLVFKRKE